MDYICINWLFCYVVLILQHKKTVIIIEHRSNKVTIVTRLDFCVLSKTARLTKENRIIFSLKDNHEENINVTDKDFIRD